jgi:hypothetical protein
MDKKKYQIAGDFQPAFTNHKVQGIARSNDQSYLSTVHTFDTFLGEREDLPRLSILSNYEQIMRIMHSNYIKKDENDLKYRNRDKKEATTDEEFA